MKKIKLTNGGYSIVSLENYEELSKYKWHSSPTGYVLRNKDLSKMHRILLNAPRELQVDHINGIKTDNRLCNLRLVTQTQNIHNMSKRKSVVNQYRGTRYRKTVVIGRQDVVCLVMIFIWVFLKLKYQLVGLMKRKPENYPLFINIKFFH